MPAATYARYTQRKATQSKWWNTSTSSTPVPGVISLPYPAVAPATTPLVAVYSRISFGEARFM